MHFDVQYYVLAMASRRNGIVYPNVKKKEKCGKRMGSHKRRYSGDFFINWISALYWSKVVGPANWCSVTHFTNKKNVFKIRQGCTKAAITEKEREVLEEMLNEIWVRFPYNPIPLLCTQHFHTFSHKYFSLTKVETCMQKKALYLSSKVFSTKVLIGDTIFTSPTGDGIVILRGSPSHAKA